MAVFREIDKLDLVEGWFERRSYDHTLFADLDSLAARKRERGISVSAILPAREVADTLVFMDGGVIVEEGPPAELFGAPRSPRLRSFLSRHNADRKVLQ